MQLLFKRSAAIVTLSLFLVPSAVSAATLEGQLISLAPQGAGLWKVAVKGSGGTTNLMISTKTVIQKEVPVETLKAGDRLVSHISTGGQGGVPGIKDPFSNMADSTKKALGLPNIPNIPGIPKIPPMPDKNQIVKGNGSSAPSGGSSAPAASAGAAPAPAAAGPAGPAGPGGGPAKKPAAEPPKVKTQDEMLQEKGFQNEKLLFPPKAGISRPGDEVTQVKKTDLGFEVTVVSATGKPEKRMIGLGKKVLKVFPLKEIKKDDKVLLSFNEKDKLITELQVKE